MPIKRTLKPAKDGPVPKKKEPPITKSIKDHPGKRLYNDPLKPTESWEPGRRG